MTNLHALFTTARVEAHQADLRRDAAAHRLRRTARQAAHTPVPAVAPRREPLLPLPGLLPSRSGRRRKVVRHA